jgi:uncharacterized membrane protein YgcG
MMLFLVCFMFLLSQNVLAAEAFTIQQFDVQATVGTDTRVEIRETIQLNFSLERRGIIRDIPLRYKGSPIRITDIRVEGDPYQVTVENDVASIRIGDANQYIIGPKTYTLRYTLIFGKTVLGEREELYLNLIGVDWDTTIDRVNYIVDMPAAFDANQVNLTLGRIGSENTAGVTKRISGLQISGETTQVLQNFEGVTIRVDLPQGYYSTYRVPGEGAIYYLPGFAGLILLFTYFVWHSRGRDNHLVITPEFYPPEGITPAEAGYIYDGAVSPSDVTSLILYWASQGYLFVEDMGKDQFNLIRRKPLPTGTPPYASFFFDSLFQGGRNEVSTKTLAGTFSTEMSSAIRMVGDYFNGNPQRNLIQRSSMISSILSSALAILPLWAFGTIAFVRSSGFFFDVGAIGIGFVMALLVFIGIAGLCTVLTKGKVMPRSSTVTMTIFSILMLIAGMAVLFVVSAQIDLAYVLIPVVIMAFAAHLLGRLTIKRTPYGDRIMGKLLGFRRFLTTAEKARIERLLEEKPSYFYDILPYAQVLRVTRIWSEKFKDLTMEAPEWYRGSQAGHFNAWMFANSMNRSMNSVGTALAHNPQSGSGGRGFGGGGFSGGGGGGGGGRSW